MTSKSRLCTLLAAGSLLVAGAGAPVLADQAMNDAFVSNVRPNVDFLDRSSRMALDKTSNARIKAFAHDEAKAETITANSLVAWTQTNTRAGEAVALGAVPAPSIAGPLGPLGDLAIAPLSVAGNVTSDVTGGVGEVLTGRSVAIDPVAPLIVTRTPDPTVARTLPAEAQDLSRLLSLNGREFDALYTSTQSDALHQLATLYRDYLRNGDDPALRAIATRELPRVTARIAGLRRL